MLASTLGTAIFSEILPERYEYDKVSMLGFVLDEQQWQQYCVARKRFPVHADDWVSVKIEPGTITVKHTAHNSLLLIPTSGMRMIERIGTVHQQLTDGIRVTTVTSSAIRSTLFKCRRIKGLNSIAETADTGYIKRINWLCTRLGISTRRVSVKEADIVIEILLNMLFHEYRSHSAFTESEFKQAVNYAEKLHNAYSVGGRR